MESIGNEIPSLNRVAISLLQNVNKYPIKHTFGLYECYKNEININNLYNNIPLYMRPHVQLNSASIMVMI